MQLQVSKSVAIVHEFVRLCNDIAPGSFDEDGRSVEFRRLDSSRIQPIALFGHSEDVWKAMTDVGAAQPSMGSLMSERAWPNLNKPPRGRLHLAITVQLIIMPLAVALAVHAKSSGGRDFPDVPHAHVG